MEILRVIVGSIGVIHLLTKSTDPPSRVEGSEFRIASLMLGA